MGQNRKIGQGQSNDLAINANTAIPTEARELSVTEKELIDDTAFELRLFRLQIVVVIVISALAILREVFFPSNIALLEMVRGMI